MLLSADNQSDETYFKLTGGIQDGVHTRVWSLSVCLYSSLLLVLLNVIVCEIASRILALLSVCICFQNCI